MKKLLVLGVGNILLTDEGIGVHAVHELMKEEWPGDVEFIDGGTFTQDIFYLFQDYEIILVLDIVKGGKTPGTIYRLAESDLRKDESQTLSLHDIDLLDSLSMTELMGHRPELHVLGIEPETLSWSMEMSPRFKQLFPDFLKIARQEIKRLLA
ncbi:HyaD1 [Desulforapulum autotrophicum HRM2]|uniref:HyaD1 n=1 Tax=Desulforapulum autotrophicum (strain ATCC 43914 / DSM 3382 / VKM B-1955 / HRM2) TaxID=177437 RepID=C0QLX3_DESAH|nr:NiFeSe hydrogenase maturation protease [Desulforapulum autotrophicum]ACN14279.1 HyaD1 [Desulforapulum autotrophicum HRM2]